MKRTIAAIAAALILTGCFKKVTNDTTFVIKPNLQTVSGGSLTAAEGVTGPTPTTAWARSGASPRTKMPLHA